MKGWAELDLEAKANVLWAAAGIVVCVLAGYAFVRTARTSKRIEKRLHLDGDDDG